MAAKIAGIFLGLTIVCATAASAQNVSIFNSHRHGDKVEHPHDHPQWFENSRITQTPSGVRNPIDFEFSATGITTDPTGLFTDEELAEGGSKVQPPIWYSTFPVDGGTVTLAILVDRWCGAQECPFRFRLEVDGGGMVLHSHVGRNYGMICQNTDAMTVDPIDLTIMACGAVTDLKTAR